MITIRARKRSGRPVTDEVWEEAIARGKRLYGSIRRARAVRFEGLNRELQIDFEDGDSVRLPVQRSLELASLSDDQLSRLEVGFAGKGLYLDEADLHVGIQSLIAECRSEASGVVTLQGIKDKVRVGLNIKQIREMYDRAGKLSASTDADALKHRRWTLARGEVYHGVRASLNFGRTPVSKGLLSRPSAKKKMRT